MRKADQADRNKIVKGQIGGETTFHLFRPLKQPVLIAKYVGGVLIVAKGLYEIVQHNPALGSTIFDFFARFTH